MSKVGYNTVIKRSGTSTSFVDESMSATENTNQYQIDDVTKRVLDMGTEPTFFEDSTSIPSSDIENINYLFGKVTFSTEKTGVITVDGSYFPTQVIGRGKEYSLEQSVNLEDSTSFDTAQQNNGYKTYTETLWDVNASISRFIDDMTETNSLQSIWENGETIVIEIQPGGTGNPIFRGYMVIETDNLTGDIESLEEQEINFLLNDIGNGKGFGWSDF